MEPTENRLEYEIILNQVRQHVIGMEQAIAWFTSLPPDEQKAVLQILNYMTLQAGANSSDVQLAIENARLKATYTPCVLLARGNLNASMAKALQLPNSEHCKLFRLLLALYEIADKRRLEACGSRCGHWWHADLGKAETINAIRRKYANGTL